MPGSLFIIKLLGVPAARWLLSRAPSWIVRKFYADDRLSKQIEIRTTLSHEGPTLRLETWFEMARLVLNFVLQDTSLYRDVRVDRLIVSINNGLDLTYEGWAAESPPTRIQIIAPLTSAQAAWLKNISGALPSVDTQNRP